MRHFYENALGCQFVNEVAVPADKARQAALSDGGYIVVRLQTSYGERIKLLAPVNPPAAVVRSGPILEQPNACYLTFIVDDIDAAIARLQAHSVEFLTGPTRVEVRPVPSCRSAATPRAMCWSWCSTPTFTPTGPT